MLVYVSNVVFDSTHFYPHLILPLSPSALHYQAAADFAKAHLSEALRQQLLTYERDKERDREKDKEKDNKKDRSDLSYPSILKQQILTLDRDMLDKLSAAYNEAGVCVFVCYIPQQPEKITLNCIKHVHITIHIRYISVWQFPALVMSY